MASDFRELGSTGLNRQGGFVSEEFLPQLRGSRAAKVYAEMRDNSAVIGAMLFTFEMLLRSVAWRVEPVSRSIEDMQNANFIETCLDDMSHTWDSFVSEESSKLVFGWSLFEIVYKLRLGSEPKRGKPKSKYNDGKVGWRKLPIRAQETLSNWDFDAEGGIKAFRQIAPPDYMERVIPVEKFLLFRTVARKGNPEGRSTLRNAYRSWYFAKKIEEIEAIGIERDLAGLPIAKLPDAVLSSTATADQQAILAAAKEIVVNIRRDEQEGVVWPLSYDEAGNELYKLELLTSGGKRQFNTDEVLNRYDRRIAMSGLADVLLLGQSSVGARALAEPKIKLLERAVGSWLADTESVMNQHAIPRLFALNGVNGPYPQMRHSKLDVPDLREIADFIQKLTGVGALIPDRNLESHLRMVSALPEREDSDEMIVPGLPDSDAPVVEESEN